MLNSAFEKNLENICTEFGEKLHEYQHVYSIHHTDADGICSGALIKTLLTHLHCSFTQSAFNLNIPWKVFLQRFSPSIKPKSTLIFSDLCPPMQDLNNFLRNHPDLLVFILDHHMIDDQIDEAVSIRVFNANPTLFQLHGLKEIVGSTLNYLFCHYIEQKMEKYAWLAVIGMGGDVLDHVNDYRSYNRQVMEAAVQNQQVELHDGICLYGGQFLKIADALTLSILPFVSSVEGNPQKAKKFVASLQIDPRTPLTALSSIQIQQLSKSLGISSLHGKYLTFPRKRGLLQFPFEHAQLVSLIGHHTPTQAMDLLGAVRATREQKGQYISFIRGIVTNLAAFMKLSKIETQSAIIATVSPHIPSSMWSDTASFATLNQIYDTKKVLFIGGSTEEGTVKYSVRCSQNFIDSHEGLGANRIIQRIISEIGGNGGGHSLAGGIRIDPQHISTLTQQIDSIIAKH